MTKRRIENLFRASFGAWGVALVVLSYSAVAICDSCGGGGDEAFQWLGAISGAVAIVIAVARGAPLSLQWILLAVQVGLLLPAYKSAGAGAGAVRISPVVVIVGAALELTGFVALAVTRSRATEPRP